MVFHLPTLSVQGRGLRVFLESQDHLPTKQAKPFAFRAAIGNQGRVAPKMSAVQLAAAITTYARIHMYPFISRSDSYYTDRDSIVIWSPLPDECVSSMEMGKFKLENKVLKGFFLAPKRYGYIIFTS